LSPNSALLTDAYLALRAPFGAAKRGRYCHSAGNARIGARDLVIAGVAVLFLSGCTHDLRRIDLSDPRTSNPGQNVSYLLVDKSDYSADGQVLVERIDDTTVDLVLDPAVYIVNSGKHTISFACNDFRKEKKSEEQLAVMMRPGHYYQVIPIRRVRIEDMRFELAEITKDKSQSIGGENSRV